MAAELIVLVLDLNDQLRAEQLSRWIEPDSAGVTQQVWMEQERRTLALNAVVRREILP